MNPSHDEHTQDPAPVTPPPDTNGGNGGEETPAWLPARLQRAEESARKRLLAELGIDDPLKGKQLISDAIQRQQAEMTEAQKARADADALKPRAERADALEAALKATVELRIKKLAKQHQSLVPDFDDPVKTLAWLDANEAALSQPVPPNLNPGTQGDSTKKDPQLTPEQEALIAKIPGMTREKYIAQLKRLQG